MEDSNKEEEELMKKPLPLFPSKARGGDSQV